MTRLDTRIVTALLARDSKDATYKFALLRAIVQCVTEQRAHKRIEENPFAREKGTGEGGAGEGRGVTSTRETPSTRNPTAPGDEASRKLIHPDDKPATKNDPRDDGPSRKLLLPDDGSTQKPILPNAPYVISYPLGLLVYFWMFYYYPIFAHRVFIPQKHGEGPDLGAGRTIAFRREFNSVIDFYRDKGGLPQFRCNPIHQSLPGGFILTL